MHTFNILLLFISFFTITIQSGIIHASNSLLISLLAIYFAIATLYHAYKGRNFFLTIFYWSVSFFIIFPFAYQINSGINYWNLTFSDYDIYQYFTLITTSIISFHIGFDFIPRYKKKILSRQSRQLKHPLKSVITIILIMYVYNTYIIMYIGINNFLSSREVFFTRLISSGIDQGYQLWLYAYLPKITSLLCLANLILIGKFYTKKITYYFLIITAFVLYIIINFPTSTPRFMMFFSASILFYSLFSFDKKHLISSFLVITTFAMFFLSNILSSMRRGEIGQAINLERYFTSGDFDASSNIILTINYIQENGFKLGESIFSVILSFIPRAIWPNKYLGTAEAIAEWYSLPSDNISMPLFAEFWVDFGYFGSIVLFIIFGYVAKITTTQQWPIQKITYYNPLFLLPISLGAMTPWFIRGSLLVSFSLFIIYLCWFLALIYIDKLIRIISKHAK